MLVYGPARWYARVTVCDAGVCVQVFHSAHPLRHTRSLWKQVEKFVVEDQPFHVVLDHVYHHLQTLKPNTTGSDQ